MATTKTLTPTNQTITIDAFQGEKPDHRHVADAETKLADAVNALNSQILFNLGNVGDAEFDALTAPGIYAGWIKSGASCPAKGQWAFILVFSSTAGYASQVVLSAQTSAIVCSRYLNNGTWGNWSSVNDRMSYDTSSTTTIDLTASKYDRTIWMLVSGNGGMSIITIWMGSANIVDIKAHSDISTSLGGTNNRVLTITPSGQITFSLTKM